MVSADNLNLDCLELVFAYLSGNDLFAVSLVSKSFLAGVIPYLYRTLVYHLGNAKRYPAVCLSRARRAWTDESAGVDTVRGHRATPRARGTCAQYRYAASRRHAEPTQVNTRHTHRAARQ